MASLPVQPPDQVTGPMSAGTQPFRPPVFMKMEALVREMQDSETGVPVRSQKMFLTSIPSAFMGYDLIEWLMEHYNIEDSLEAIHIANLLCQHGYFFPVGEAKSLMVKDDSSLYRFQTPYYWPSKDHCPDDNEYAVYLTKRHMRNKQKHALEDWEQEEISKLKQTLCGKWDIITHQAEEQMKQSKDFKKGDKMVNDSQERAYWRVYRPPPGQCSVLDSIPIQQKRPTSRKHITFTSSRALKKYVVYLRESMNHNRVKVSTASESVIQRWENFCDHDPIFSCPHAPNPWLSEDTLFWTHNAGLVETPTERRVRRWAISVEETLNDPTGAREFETYLHKEYSHENIRFFWRVREHRYGSIAGVEDRVKKIYSEFLVTGAPCEVNIDCATMESTLESMKQPSHHTFNLAQDHVYMLLKKDCYPRFLRSGHYNNIAQNSIPPQSKRRFFSFATPRKKHSTVAANMMCISGAPSSVPGSSLPVIEERLPNKGKEERAGSGDKSKLSLASAAGVVIRPWEDKKDSLLGKAVGAWDGKGKRPSDDTSDWDEPPVVTVLPKLEPRSALTIDENYTSLRLSPKKERKAGESPCELPVSPKKERKISNASISSMPVSKVTASIVTVSTAVATATTGGVMATSATNITSTSSVAVSTVASTISNATTTATVSTAATSTITTTSTTATATSHLPSFTATATTTITTTTTATAMTTTTTSTVTTTSTITMEEDKKGSVEIEKVPQETNTEVKEERKASLDMGEERKDSSVGMEERKEKPEEVTEAKARASVSSEVECVPEVETVGGMEQGSDLKKETESTEVTEATRKPSSSSFLELSSSALDMNLSVQDTPETCLEKGDPSEQQGEDGYNDDVQVPSSSDVQEKRPSEISITLGKAEELPISPTHSPGQQDLSEALTNKTETKIVTFCESLNVSIITPQEPVFSDESFATETGEKKKEVKGKTRERRRSKRKQTPPKVETVVIPQTTAETVKELVGVSVDEERISPVQCLVTEEQETTKPIQTPEICPWEDEDNCKLETHSPFVKMYATLGYL